jgi:hypothetical protein
MEPIFSSRGGLLVWGQNRKTESTFRKGDPAIVKAAAFKNVRLFKFLPELKSAIEMEIFFLSDSDSNRLALPSFVQRQQ